MKLVSMRCPHCGGSLQLSQNSKQAVCPYCNTLIAIDDEVQHVQFDNSEKAEYDFERGRIKAQQDVAYAQIAAEQARAKAQADATRKRKNRVWWVLGWIFIFPVPLTILIAKSKKLKTVWKVLLIIALWGAVILIGAINNNNQDSAKVGTAQVHTIVSVTDNMG